MLFRSTVVFMPGVWCEFFIYYTQGLSKQVFLSLGFPGGTSGKESACRRHKRCRFSPRVRKIPWRTAWQPTPVFLPWESYGQRSPRGCKELDTTEWLTHTLNIRKKMKHLASNWRKFCQCGNLIMYFVCFLSTYGHGLCPSCSLLHFQCSACSINGYSKNV